jgi:glucose-1-phosphate cytidylyltransferase
MKDVPVVILCGGMGMRLKEETEFRPKPLVEIGDRPILWHIMQSYAVDGFERFVLCLGFRGDAIKNYFVNYHLTTGDVEVTLGGKPKVRVLGDEFSENWQITLADTGLKTMTGARIKRIQKYIDTDYFMLTYGDAVSDVDVSGLCDFHRRHGRIGTVTGVRPPSRFGELEVDQGTVTCFAEKPVQAGLINGGFFVFDRRIFDYVSAQENCVFEQEPLEKLASDGELMVYQHDGFWQCMDTMRDVMLLRALEETGERPWLRKKNVAR